MSGDVVAELTTLAAQRRGAVVPGFRTEAAFELLQRQARALTMSSLVPAAYRAWRDDGTENPECLANTMVALNMASRMNADPLMVMQNLYVVHGTPAWSAKFLIATFNTCGRFSAMRYAFNDDRTSCYAMARELATGETVRGPAASMTMARAEGWIDRKGSKWRTMPEVMLTFRAAAFLIRTVAPELSLGLMTREEVDDVIDVGALRELDDRMGATPIAQVRDILKSEPAPPAPTPDVSESESTDARLADAEPSVAPDTLPPPDYRLDEPKNLPIKDGELLANIPAQRRPKAKPTGPAFNVDVYARRIAACADVDMLTLMRDEVAALPPSFERDDLLSVVDARTRELLPPTEEIES
jgi:hypothetical protein